MNAEPIRVARPDSDVLAQRAARYGALSEPLRIQICDLLACSDLSPSELRAFLGISSNLLAHHLSVLESNALVLRQRSEGDHRRSYVSLLPAARRLLTYEQTVKGWVHEPPQMLVFICTGNTARSPFASGVWNHLQPQGGGIQATSAGTHPVAGVSPVAIRAARAHGVDLSGHIPCKLGYVDQDALVIVLCDKAYEELARNHDFPARHWSIPNPGVVDTPSAYARAFDDIAERLSDLLTDTAA